MRGMRVSDGRVNQMAPCLRAGLAGSGQRTPCLRAGLATVKVRNPMKTTRTTLTIAGALGVLAWTAASTALAGSERGDSIRIAAAPTATGGGTWVQARANSGGTTRSETISKVGDVEVRVISEDGKPQVFVNGKAIEIDSATGAWTDKESNVRIERKGGRMFVLRGDEQIMSFSADGSNVFTGDRMRLWNDNAGRMRGLGGMGQSGAEAFARQFNEAANPPPVMLGVTLEPLSEESDVTIDLEHEDGATVIRRVFKGLPADKAGLHEMDVIIEIDGSAEAGPDALRKMLAEKQPGQKLKLKVVREGQPKDIVVDLAPYDAEKIGAPRVWGWNSGGDSFFTDEGRQRLEELQKTLADSAKEMAQLQQMLMSKSGKDAEQFSRQMAELATKMSAQSAELARRSAELSAPDVARFFSDREGQGGRAFGFGGGMPLKFRTNPDGSQAIIVTPEPPDPPEAPAAPDAAEAPSDRLDALNARLDRLERLLQKLVKEQE